jgi:hypothetical protein
MPDLPADLLADRDRLYGPAAGTRRAAGHRVQAGAGRVRNHLGKGPGVVGCRDPAAGCSIPSEGPARSKHSAGKVRRPEGRDQGRHRRAEGVREAARRMAVVVVRACLP